MGNPVSMFNIPRGYYYIANSVRFKLINNFRYQAVAQERYVRLLRLINYKKERLLVYILELGQVKTLSGPSAATRTG